MSASLVGSEMCIRDRPRAACRPCGRVARTRIGSWNPRIPHRTRRRRARNRHCPPGPGPTSGQGRDRTYPGWCPGRGPPAGTRFATGAPRSLHV
eukprot:617715-Alexandrium_andersonii.AAC.1